MTKRYFFLISALLCMLGAKAQFNVSGVAYCEAENAMVTKYSVSLLQNDSLVMTSNPFADGSYLLRQVPAGEYHVEVDAFGYEVLDTLVNISDHLGLNFPLTPLKRYDLNELEVSTNRSLTSKTTSSGRMFFLSEKAKKMSDPYEALNEIPVLKTDIANRSVALLSGDSPLVLINGVEMNSGIAPINPKDIISVEVIEHPSARYAMSGVTSIINITLREREHPYQYYSLNTRHELPLATGFAIGNAEVGNKKFSVYALAAYNYSHHIDTDRDIVRSDIGYTQSKKTSTRKNANDWEGTLMLKYTPDDKNYFAASFSAKPNNSHSYTDGEGLINYGTAEEFTEKTDDRIKADFYSASAFYQHKFSQNRKLEVKADYANSSSRNTTEAQYNYPASAYTDLINLKMNRDLGLWNVNYSEAKGSHTFMAGYNGSVVKNTVANRDLPTDPYKYNELNHYVYAGWANQYLNKLWLNISGGAQIFTMKSGELSKTYFQPRVNLSASWTFNNYNATTLYFNYYTKAPELSYLSPVNTSTDPLYIYRGNPDLRPEDYSIVSIEHAYMAGGWYLQPSITFQRTGNMFSSTGRTLPDGTYLKTIENLGSLKLFGGKMSINRSFNNVRVYFTGEWWQLYYPEVGSRGQFSVYLGANYSIKKFYFNFNIKYNNRNNARYSQTLYRNLNSLTLLASYRPTPELNISVGLHNFSGPYRTHDIYRQGTFSSSTITNYKNLGIHPSITISYTFRKNQERKIKLDNVLSAPGKAISL